MKAAYVVVGGAASKKSGFGRDDKAGSFDWNPLLVERTADPSTSVGMTKGRAASPTLVREPQIPPLRSG
jgi:hypothetical protein